MTSSHNAPACSANKFVLFVLAGGVGGYIFGVVAGLFESFSFHQALSFGGHTLISGALAGFLGYAAFRLVRRLAPVVGYAATLGVAGGVFYGSTTLLTQSFFEKSFLSRSGPLVSFVAGVVGGVMAGLVLFMMTRRSRNREKKAS